MIQKKTKTEICGLDIGKGVYNGQILQGQLYYGIDNTEFIDSMKRYLMDVYGERIETIV